MKRNFYLLALLGLLSLLLSQNANAQNTDSTLFYGTVFDTLTAIINPNDSITYVKIGTEYSEWFQQTDSVLRFKVPFKAPNAGDIVVGLGRIAAVPPYARVVFSQDIGNFNLVPLNLIDVFGNLTAYGIVARKIVGSGNLNLSALILADTISPNIAISAMDSLHLKKSETEKNLSQLRAYILNRFTLTGLNPTTDTIYIGQNTLVQGTGSLSLTNKVFVIDSTANNPLVVFNATEALSFDSVQFVYNSKKFNPNYVMAFARFITLTKARGFVGNIVADDSVRLNSNLGGGGIFTKTLKISAVPNGISGIQNFVDLALATLTAPAYP
ncbi:hypothetical protein, partial [Umezakia ovalisporum]|uniref:hypothetical protein n=1 Tax=Umezakia ovalisporum TaxID=75695 RepID=UPI0039C717B0